MSVDICVLFVNSNRIGFFASLDSIKFGAIHVFAFPNANLIITLKPTTFEMSSNLRGKIHYVSLKDFV